MKRTTIMAEEETLKRLRELAHQDASIVAICERLREPKVATLDSRHFSVVRPRHIAALRLLPA
jgi:hypothetical protein